MIKLQLKADTKPLSKLAIMVPYIARCTNPPGGAEDVRVVMVTPGTAVDGQRLVVFFRQGEQTALQSSEAYLLDAYDIIRPLGPDESVTICGCEQ